jgi:hypothetical protein
MVSNSVIALLQRTTDKKKKATRTLPHYVIMLEILRENLDLHLGSKQPALELLYAHKRVNFKQTIIC